VTTDIDDLLCRANPVILVEPYPAAERNALLDRVTTFAPRHPRRARRPLALTGAVLTLTAIALVVQNSAGPSRALAGLELERDGSGYRVVVTDVERDAKDLTDAMHGYGYDITLAVLPVSPSLVGSIVSGSSSGGSDELQPLHDGPCLATAGCEVGFRIPADWKGKAVVVVGRVARPGERYASVASAFDDGEFLGCSFQRGMRVSELLPELARRGISVQYRPEGAPAGSMVQSDWIVTDVLPGTATSAFLFASPTAPSRPSAGQHC
jgi:hypothetical protein